MNLHSHERLLLSTQRFQLLTRMRKNLTTVVPIIDPTPNITKSFHFKTRLKPSSDAEECGLGIDFFLEIRYHNSRAEQHPQDMLKELFTYGQLENKFTEEPSLCLLSRSPCTLMLFRNGLSCFSLIVPSMAWQLLDKFELNRKPTPKESRPSFSLH